MWCKLVVSKLGYFTLNFGLSCAAELARIQRRYIFNEDGERFSTGAFDDRRVFPTSSDRRPASDRICRLQGPNADWVFVPRSPADRAANGRDGALLQQQRCVQYVAASNSLHLYIILFIGPSLLSPSRGR